MTVLITGGTGFVGLNIARAFIERGDEVVLFAPSLRESLLPGPVASLAWLERARFVAGDVRSAADIARAFAGSTITHVVHAAAVTPDVRAETEDPATIAAVNLEGTLRVLQAAAAARVARTLVLSSVAVYGDVPAGVPIDEAETPPRPITLYGITKLAAEQSAQRFASLHEMDVVTVRLGACFGAYEYRTGDRVLMSPHWQAVEAALAGEACVLSREMAVDWVDAGEAGRAIAGLLMAGWLPHRLFHVGGHTVTSVAEWCRALAALRPGFTWSVDPARTTVQVGFARDRPALRTDRLHAALGWRPDSAGLAQKAASYLEWRLGDEGRTMLGDVP